MAPFLAAVLPGLLEAGKQAVASIFPSEEQKAQREAGQAAIVTAIIDRAQAMELAGAQIVNTEAASRHWLAANWRPLTMLTFVGLIVSRWLGYAAPNLGEAEILKLWDIVELGLGGYVIGRTAEKLGPQLIGAFKR